MPRPLRIPTMRRLALSLATVVVLLAGCAPTTTAQTTTAPTAEVPPVTQDDTLVAFYGDSYTLGTGASDPSKRWSTIVSEQRGWTEFNPSVNGLGFVNNRGGLDLPGEIIAADPDIVFVTMGLNDNFSFDVAAEQIRAAIDDDLTRLSTQLPDARIVVVEPFWYTDERPASVQTIIDWVSESADRIGADFIPGASRWIEGRPDWIGPDGLHPNDAGYAEMARRMDAALRELGL